MTTPTDNPTAPSTGAELEKTLATIADNFSITARSPVLHTPAEHGLAYEDVTFPSEDGTPLEGWFVPADGAAAVVIANHPRFFSRSGLPSHLDPWRSIGRETGNDIEVNLVPDIKVLHDAGYHVLAYDLRSSGHSGTANGGLTSSGIFESRDVVGSLRYVRSRPELDSATVVLFSRCLGANATLFAMERAPAEFDRVRCLVACQPLSPRMVIESTLRRRSIPSHHIDEVDARIRLRTSFDLDTMSPFRAAASVRVPTFVYQVRDDVTTRSSDVQAIFDAMPGNPAPEKELFWIEGTTRRWDGYLHFQREPEQVLAWTATYA